MSPSIFFKKRRNQMRLFYMLPLFFSLLGAEKLVKVEKISRGEVRDILKTFPRSAVQTREGDSYIMILEDEAIDFLRKRGYRISTLLDMDKWREEVKEWIFQSDYHSYSEMVTDLVNLASNYPSLARLDTIGYSVEGRLILALKISDNVNVKEPEPEIRIVGTHHGNEWISTEIPILLAHYLLENYGILQEVTDMVNEREIWIIPMVNPDGHEGITRYNSNGVDLNRDYGYMWEGWGGSVSPYSQPETRYMYMFSQKHNFTLSLSFHSYGEIVNYIWNYSPIEPPDSQMIREFSYGYASFNGYWVTEGYDWYETHGDLNDYSFGIDSDVDWTIELANQFIPPASQIPTIWNENRDAIMYIIKKGGQGIGGFVIDSTTGDTLKEVRIIVDGLDWCYYSDRETGDFMRVLLPGVYSLRFEANGYASQEITGIPVYEDSLTWITVYTYPQEGYYGYKYVWANIADPNNSFNNSTLTHWGLGPPDGQFVSLGVGGEVVIDMGEGTWIDSTFTVYEGDDGVSGEGYSIWVSQDWNGPWFSVGTGYGTQSFDISSIGLDSVRYVRIKDDGDGNPNSSTPGFDLDAIKVGPALYPDIGLNPLSFDVLLQPGSIDTEFLYISNLGEMPLHFIIRDIENPSRTARVKNPSGGFEAEPRKGEKDPPGGTSPEGSGGPDDFGYYWIDSDEPGGPEFNWIDIASYGTPLFLGDDDYETVTLPFIFPFYGENKTSMKISSNGYLTFGSDGTDYSNDPIPSPIDPNDFIATFWDDLNPPAGGAIYYYYDAVNDRFIVEWQNVPHYSYGGPYTFEAILYPNGDIVFQYLNMVSRLEEATIGIENSDASIGLQVVYNAPYVHNNLAVLITTETGWLYVEPSEGIVDPGEEASVKVFLDASELQTGTYTGSIIVISNDPDEDTLVVPVTLTVESYIPGDANGDGAVNTADLSYIANYLYFGGPPPSPLLAGDSNGDCDVNTADLSYLANYLFFGGPSPQFCN
jgi:hypothetical protein